MTLVILKVLHGFQYRSPMKSHVHMYDVMLYICTIHIPYADSTVMYRNPSHAF
jgi:hypothetical protein